MNALVVADCLGLRQFAGSAINPTVNAPALDRVGRLGPFTLHPFEISETRAILKLVYHACGHIGLIRPQRRGREREFGLGVDQKLATLGALTARAGGRWPNRPLRLPALVTFRPAPAGAACYSSSACLPWHSVTPPPMWTHAYTTTRGSAHHRLSSLKLTSEPNMNIIPPLAPIEGVWTAAVSRTG
jgi:hypothetical protein